MVRRCICPLALLFLLALTGLLVAACGREREPDRVFPTPTPLKGAVIVVPDSPLPQPVSPLGMPTSTPTWTLAPTSTPEPGATATPTPSPTWTPYPTLTPTPWDEYIPEDPWKCCGGDYLAITPRQAAYIARDHLAQRERVDPALVYAEGWNPMTFFGLRRDISGFPLRIEGSPEGSSEVIWVDMATGAIVGAEEYEKMQRDDPVALQARCGKLQPDLCIRLETAVPEQRIQVAFWVSDVDGIDNMAAADEELFRLFPDAEEANRTTGFPGNVADEARAREIMRVRDLLVSEQTQKDLAPLYAWLQEEGIIGEDTAPMPSLFANLTAEQIRRAEQIDNVGTIYYLAGGDVDPSMATPVVTPAPTATQISASPLLDARPPPGVIGIPGQRLTEPVWPMLTLDGRTLWLSQAEGENRALDWVQGDGNFARADLAVTSVGLEHFSEQNRDLLRVTISHPPLEDRWPFRWEYELLVDLQTGEVVDTNSAQPPYSYYDSAGSAWGKMDEGLYKALQLAHPGTLLPVVISASGPSGYDTSQEAERQMRAKYGDEFNTLRAGQYMLEDRRKVLQEEWWALQKELDIAASAPLRADLDALGIEYAWRGRERSVDAWLTQQQVGEVAQLDAVADMRYVGYPDPNYVAPTPTALPQGWEYVSFESVAFTLSGHSVEGQDAGAQIVSNIVDVPTNIFDPNATPNPVTGDDPTYFYIYAWRSGVSSSCYSIEIKRTVLAGNTLKVFADMWEPTEGMACTADSMTVQHIVSIDRAAVGVDPRLLNLELAPTTRLGTNSWGRP